MKKILILAAAIGLSANSFAQTAALTLTNHISDCKVGVTAYAFSASAGSVPSGGACTTICSRGTIMLGAGGPPLAWTDPANFELTQGWVQPPLTSVGSVMTSSYPYYYSDFQWTHIDFDIDCPCGVDLEGTLGNPVLGSLWLITCGNSFIGFGACAGHYATITATGTSLADIAVDFY